MDTADRDLKALGNELSVRPEIAELQADPVRLRQRIETVAVHTISLCLVIAGSISTGYLTLGAMPNQVGRDDALRRALADGWSNRRAGLSS